LTTGYNVPGVYVRDTTGPLVSTAGLPESVVTLIGPAVGYQTITEAVVIGDDPVVLSKRGVWLSTTGAPAGVFVPTVTDASGQALTATTDYVLALDLSPGGGAANAITTIERGPDVDSDDAGTVISDNEGTVHGVKRGDTLVITYCYTDAAYFTPLVFDNFDTVEATYGSALLKVAPALPTTPQITSPLSLAALIAFSNGASSVICVATDPTPIDDDVPSLRDQLVAAYAKTEGDYRVGTVVPVLADDDSDGTPALFENYATDLKAHVEGSSADGFPRIGIIGASSVYGAAAGVGAPAFDDAARAVKSSRVVMAYPNRVNLYNPNINRITEVSGYYLAAAYAGILASNPVQQSLTREVVAGFAGFPASVTRYQTKQFKDRLSGAGVAVTEVDRQNRMVIRHGLSTDNTNVLTREVSITRGRDALFDALQLGLDASGLIGAAIDGEMTRRVQGAVVGIVEALVQAETIVAYDNVQVRQQTIEDGGDPSVIEVKFAYRPAIPLNYIVVSFSLNLSTGSITTDTDASAQAQAFPTS
jgi:hypothetical protein